MIDESKNYLDPDAGISMEETDTAIPGTKTEDQTQKLFTQEEFNALLQQKLAEEKETARLQTERKLSMSLAEREQVLAEREANINRKEAETAAQKLLEAKGMSPKLSRFLDFTDENTLNTSIGELEKVFKAAVQTGVENRFKRDGYTPRGTGIGHLSSTAEPDDAFVQSLKRRSGRRG